MRDAEVPCCTLIHAHLAKEQAGRSPSLHPTLSFFRRIPLTISPVRTYIASERRSDGYRIPPNCRHGKHPALRSSIHLGIGSGARLDLASLRLARASGNDPCCCRNAPSSGCAGAELSNLVRAKVAVSSQSRLAPSLVRHACRREGRVSFKPNRSRVIEVLLTISKQSQLPRNVASDTAANLGHTPHGCWIT